MSVQHRNATFVQIQACMNSVIMKEPLCFPPFLDMKRCKVRRTYLSLRSGCPFPSLRSKTVQLLYLTKTHFHGVVHYYWDEAVYLTLT